MAIETDTILSILEDYGIIPRGPEDLAEIAGEMATSSPRGGQLRDGETIYSTSFDAIFNGEPNGGEPLAIWTDPSPPRAGGFSEWRDRFAQIRADGSTRRSDRAFGRPRKPPESDCAWYAPIHYFADDWGIYIRQDFILKEALKIAEFIDWRNVHLSQCDAEIQTQRAAFYVFYLHEQFHHKVESFAFRLLAASGTDRYRPYDRNVYHPNFLTSACLEESLANAESIRRLNEERYAKNLDKGIRRGLRNYLKATIPLMPPGYAEGINFVDDEKYRAGLRTFQSQLLHGTIKTNTPKRHWLIAPNMITSLMDVTDKIYVILDKNGEQVFPATWLKPRCTISSRKLIGLLTRNYGCRKVAGGKGSHIKLSKAGAPTLTVPGNESVVSPGVLKPAILAVGGSSISDLEDFIEGRLAVRG